jgi:serine/threonine protein kinase
MAKPFKPEQFGRYLLAEKIATGGMAEIFNAKIFGAMGFEKSLVVKRILPQFAEDSEFLRMFITEAKLVCHLEHPNIVQVHELGEIDGQYYIAMEYVNGIDGRHLWRTLAKRKQRLPGLLALFIVSEFLKGLDYAHRAVGPDGQLLGVVHRDVSPSNILISYRGDVKIGDFGIALVQQESKTQAGVLKGKFGYMSPEQVAGMKVDHRSDIFAAGIVLGELLLGRRLFLGQSDFETLDKVLNVRLDVLDEHENALPPEVVKIVRKALKREVGERYQSAQEFCDGIVEFLYDRRARITNETLAAFIAEHVAPYLVPNTGNREVSAPSVSSAGRGSGRSPGAPLVPSGVMPVVDVGSRPVVPVDKQGKGEEGWPDETADDDSDADLALPEPARPVSRRQASALAKARPAEPRTKEPSASIGRGKEPRRPGVGRPPPKRSPDAAPRGEPKRAGRERPKTPDIAEPRGRRGLDTADSFQAVEAEEPPDKLIVSLTSPDDRPSGPPAGIDLAPLPPPDLDDPLSSLDSDSGLGASSPPLRGAPTSPSTPSFPAPDSDPLAGLGLGEEGAFGAIPVFDMDGEGGGLELEAGLDIGPTEPLEAQVEGAGEEFDLGSVEQEEDLFSSPPAAVPDDAGALVTGRLASAASQVMAMEPDFAGKLASRTVAKVLFRFSVVSETGLIVLTGPEAIGEQAELINWLRTIQERAQAESDSRTAKARTCTIHLQKGEPHLGSADRSEEALVAYLIRTEVLTSKKVEKAIYTNPHRKPVAAVLAAGMMAPLQVSRHVTAFVLANVLESFSWTEGDFAFYRDREAPSEAFPTGLDAVGMVWRGVKVMDESVLDRYMNNISGRRVFLNRTPPARLDRFDPDKMLDEAYRALSGGRTVDNLLEHLNQFGSPIEAKQSLYLLLECELAALG